MRIGVQDAVEVVLLHTVVRISPKLVRGWRGFVIPVKADKPRWFEVEVLELGEDYAVVRVAKGVSFGPAEILVQHVTTETYGGGSVKLSVPLHSRRIATSSTSG